MSNVVDERIVSLQFDNADFEKNVQQSMDTIENLNNALEFEDAGKGLESLSASTEDVTATMTTLSTNVDSTSSKFSALEVAGVTALVNITNQAIQAAESILTMFTITPISTGFEEYELKMNSIQTIMASTGESLETVNAYLNELNEYADKTIYSFSDMTSNIGKFTNAGVELEDAVLAMKGISNEAALSGASATEASRAMYNFAQALSAGYVKLIDWKSIENANMATVEFKEQLIATAVELGTLTEVTDGYETSEGTVITATSNFNDSLADQWMTTEVLIETLKDYADETTEIGEKAYAAAQDVITFTKMMDTLKEAAQSGWAATWELIIGDYEEAKSLWTELAEIFSAMIEGQTDARNEVVAAAVTSSWEQLVDQIEAAGISVDDFQNELSELATEAEVDLETLIEEEGSLEAAMQKCFEEGTLDSNVLKQAISNLANEILGTGEAASTAAEDVSDYSEVVQDVINGVYGNGEDRVTALTEAGYDWATIQNLVNEELGSSVRHTSELTEEIVENADSLSELTDEELENLGYTEDQIEALRDLALAADDAGSSISELIDDIASGKMSGRELGIDTIRNILGSISTLMTSIGNAFNEIFTVDEQSGAIYNTLTFLHNISERLVITDEAADKLKRTFKGVFAIAETIVNLFSGAFKIAINVINALFGDMNLGVLDVTASIGDAIVAVTELINAVIDSGVVYIIDVLVGAIQSIKNFVNAFLGLGTAESKLSKFANVLERIKTIADDLYEYFKNLVDLFVAGDFASIQDVLSNTIANFSNKIDLSNLFETGSFTGIGSSITEGLINGLSGGFSSVITLIKNIATQILAVFRDILGIHSPSTETTEDGENLMQGFADGIQNGLSNVISVLKSFANKVIDFFDDLTLDKVITVAFAGGLIYTANNIIKLVKSIAAPLSGLSKMFREISEVIEDANRAIRKVIKNAAKVLKSFSKVLKSFSHVLDAAAFKIVIESLTDMLKLVAILVAEIAILSLMDSSKLWNAVGIFAVITLIIAALMGVVTLCATKSAKAGSFTSVITLLGSISILVIALAGALALVATIDFENSIPKFVLFGVLITAIFAVVALIYSKSSSGTSKIEKTTSSLKKILSSFSTLAGMALLLISVATSVLLLSTAIKKLGTMDTSALIQGGVAVGILVGVLAAMAILGKTVSVKEMAVLSTLLLSLAGSMVIMMIVAGLLGKMKVSTLTQGIAAIAAFVILIAGIMRVVSKLGELKIAGLAALLISMSAAMLIMVIVIKLIAGMSIEEIGKGVVALAAFVGLIALMIVVSNLAKGVTGMSATLLAMAGCVAILAVVVVVISLLDTESLVKGIVAIGFLSVFMALMIAALKTGEMASKYYLTIIAMSAAILALAVAVMLLSLIDPQSIIVGSTAMGLLLAMFALVEKAGSSITTSTATLVVMIAAIGMIAVALYLVAQLPYDQVISAAGSLSTVLLALSAAFVIVSKFSGTMSLGTIAGIAVMSAAILVLAGCLYLMQDIDYNSAISNSYALSTLLLALSAAVSIVGNFGKFSASATAGLAVMLVVVVALVGILYAMDALGIDSALSNAVSLSVLVLSLSAACLILGSVGSIGAMALVGVGVLAALMAALAVVVPLITASLVTAGTNLSQFMENLSGFLDGVEKIDDSIVSGTKNLAEMMAVLAGASILTAISNFISGGNSYSTFADNIATFGQAIKDFADVTSGVSGDSVTVAAEAGLALAEMAANIPSSGGLLQEFFGEKDFGAFAENVGLFADAISKFSDETSSVDGDAVATAAEAGSLLVEMVSELPSSGGLLQDLFGEKDFAAFSENVESFGEAISSFSETVDGNVDYNAVKKAANAGTAIAEMASGIPTSGGLWDAIFGSNDLDDFADNIESFGEAISSFSDEVEGISTDDVDAAVDAGKLLIDLSDYFVDNVTSLPESDKITIFGERMVTFSEALVSITDAIAGESESKINESYIQSAVAAGTLMAELGQTIANNEGALGAFSDLDAITAFKENAPVYIQAIDEISALMADATLVDTSTINSVAEIGTALSSLGGTISGTEGSLSAFDNTDGLISSFADGIGVYSEAIVAFSSTISNLGDGSVDSAIAAGEGVIQLGILIGRNSDCFSAFDDVTNIDKFSDGIVNFAGAITEFQNGLISGGFTEGIASEAYTAAEAMIEIGKLIKSHTGAVNAFDDIDNIAEFTKNITSFGTAIAGFQNALTGNGDGFSSSTAVEAYNAAEAMINIGSAIVSNGSGIFGTGAIDAFDNEANIEQFVTGVTTFAEGISDFSAAISGENAVNVDSVDSLVSIVDSMFALSTSMQENETALTAFNDTGEISEFATGICEFANCVIEFSNTVTGANIAEDEVESVTDAADLIIDMASDLGDNLESMTTAFNEESDYSKFFSSLGEFTDYIITFSEKVTSASIDTSSISTVSTAIDSIAEIGESMQSDNFSIFTSSSTMEEFGDSVESFLSAISSFGEYAEITDLSSVSDFVTSMGDLASDGTDSFLAVFSDATDDIVSAGETVAANFCTGIENKISSAEDSASSMSSAAAKASRSSSAYAAFVSAGKYMVSGFASGITANTYLAKAKAAAMATAAANAAAAALDENSPSKVGYEIGDYFGQGFVMGIGDCITTVYDTAYTMASSASTGLSNAVSKIQSILDNEIDNTVTIRPVLDLTDVTSGAETISGILTMSPSVGTLSNAYAIASSMKIQNGSNDEVVSAINKLGSKITNMRTNTYTVNGVTYSDQSTTADAVKTLVRAIRVGGRS